MTKKTKNPSPAVAVAEGKINGNRCEKVWKNNPVLLFISFFKAYAGKEPGN
jgi:hypothetical protein